MSPTIDPFWLAGVLSSINETLISAIYVVGFVAALRRWKDRGRSPRFAAAGFGLGLLGDIGEMALTFVNIRFLNQSANAPGAYDSYLWPMFAACSLRSFASLAATLLILLALWFAWRDAGRAVHRNPIT